MEGARDGVFNRLRRERKGGLPSPAGAAYREDIDDPHWLCLERRPGPFFQTFCESPCLPGRSPTPRQRAADRAGPVLPASRITPSGLGRHHPARTERLCFGVMYAAHEPIILSSTPINNTVLFWYCKFLPRLDETLPVCCYNFYSLKKIN